jgi:hypothetical protein
VHVKGRLGPALIAGHDSLERLRVETEGDGSGRCHAFERPVRALLVLRCLRLGKDRRCICQELPPKESDSVSNLSTDDLVGERGAEGASV